MWPLADFFAGAGLVREALNSWQCVYALDNDPVKAAMYEARFPGTKVHICDVMRTQEVVARIPPGVVLAAGGWPCTDLSSGGKKQGLAGPLSSAWYGFLAVLEALGPRRPPLFLGENVAGLYTHHPEDFREIALGLHRLGYRLACFVLNGREFVPQSRKRVFIVGVADGLAVPEIEVPLEWELRSRPPELAMLMNDIDIPWLPLMPPPPPRRQERLADLADLESGDWWDEGRTRRHLARLTATSRRKLDRFLASPGLHVFAIGWQQKGWAIRTDGLSNCVQPHRHGSRQLIGVVEDSRLRVRHLSVVESGLLMGSSGDWTKFRPRHARIGLGDGVVVPAVRWIDTHILRPIAAGIGGSSEEASPLHRRCPAGAPADLREAGRDNGYRRGRQFSPANQTEPTDKTSGPAAPSRVGARRHAAWRRGRGRCVRSRPRQDNKADNASSQGWGAGIRGTRRRRTVGPEGAHSARASRAAGNGLDTP